MLKEELTERCKLAFVGGTGFSMRCVMFFTCLWTAGVFVPVPDNRNNVFHVHQLSRRRMRVYCVNFQGWRARFFEVYDLYIKSLGD
jgi:hypothetical protein